MFVSSSGQHEAAHAHAQDPRRAPRVRQELERRRRRPRAEPRAPLVARQARPQAVAAGASPAANDAPPTYRYAANAQTAQW